MTAYAHARVAISDEKDYCSNQPVGCVSLIVRLPPIFSTTKSLIGWVLKLTLYSGVVDALPSRTVLCRPNRIDVAATRFSQFHVWALRAPL